MRTLSFSLAAAVVTLLAGCGYHLGAVKPALLRNVDTLAVETFKNETYEPRVEVLMADTLIKQLQQDGTYEIVSDNRADAILYCTLKSSETRQARAVINNSLATREFLLRLEVDYELIDRVTGATITRGTVSGDTSFFTNRDLPTDKRQAIVTAIHDVSVKLTGILTEGF